MKKALSVGCAITTTNGAQRLTAGNVGGALSHIRKNSARVSENKRQRKYVVTFYVPLAAMAR